MRRNFLYHIYPTADNEIWLWNVRLVKQYLRHFDRIIVGIATDNDSMSAHAVSNALRDYPAIELVLTTNIRGQGELTTLPTMLDMVKSDDEDEVTFYAHAKGVSHVGRRLEAVRCWTQAMYKYNFDLEQVDDLLETHDCVGAFQRGGPYDRCVGNHYGWHYSGNFWWVKHSAFFALPWWQFLRGERHAAENFLGDLFPIADAACVGPSGPFPLYSFQAWQPGGVVFEAMKAYDTP